MSDELRLKGKVAVVTGASGGIGAAIASALVKEGASVALGARRIHSLERVHDAIRAAVGDRANIICVQTDVAKREEVKKLIAETESELGPIDILVNNAGVMHYQLLKNVNEAVWDRTVDVNCKGVLHTISAVLPGMLQRKSGHIVNISSDAARKVFAGLGVYSASKMFVEGVSQALRLENVGSGLRVTCIQPGNVKTELVSHTNAEAGVDHEAMDLYGKPSVCQVLEPDDIARTLIFAVTSPPHVAVNELLVEPRDEPI